MEKITVVTGILSALYALGQKAGLPFITRSGIARVEGTIGNASFLASYLGIIFFLTIRWLRQVRKGSPWYFFLIAGIGVELLAIYFTETRGTILALLGALVIFLIYKAKEGKGRIRSLSVGILIFIVLFGALGYVNRAKLLESKFALVQRLASAATLEDVTTRSRLFIWKESLAHVGEHPLLGVGMENFEYVYNGFYDPQIITEEWFDRSHNVYVDNLIQNGVVGLAVYLSVLGGAFYFAYRLFKEKGAGEYLFFLLLVTYAVQNFFVFDTISTFFLFFVVYAYLIRAHFNEKEIAAPRPVFLQYGLLLGALLIIISGYWWNILPLRANRALAKGYVYQLVDVPLSNKTFKEGLALGTFANLEYGFQGYEIFNNRKEQGHLSDEDIVASYDYSALLLKDLIKEYPWNVRLYIYLGHVMDGYTPAALADADYLISLMQKAITLSPKRPQPYYIIANTYIRLAQGTNDVAVQKENYNKAVKALSDYAAIVPELAEPRLILANILLSAGRAPEAETAFQKGVALYEQSPLLDERIAGYLTRLNRFKEAEPYLEDLVRFEPGKTDYAFDLVRVYYLNGKKDAAKTLLLEIQKKDPKALEGEKELVQTVLGG